MNKRGSSQITSSLFMRIGEIVLPILAFLVVLFIIISVGSNRSPQTYFEANELANILDSLATLDGLAVINYLPIENDFILSIDKSQVHVTTPDDKSPNAKQIHISQELQFENMVSSSSQPSTATPLKQLQIAKTDAKLVVFPIASTSLQVEKRENLLGCNKLGLKDGTVYLQTTHAEQTTEYELTSALKEKLISRGIKFAPTAQDASLILHVDFNSGVFNSLVVMPDASLISQEFACHSVDEVNSLQRQQIRAANVAGKNIDSAVLVPFSGTILTQNTQISGVSKPVVYYELTYVKDSDQISEVLYHPILSTVLAHSYTQVFS